MSFDVLVWMRRTDGDVAGRFDAFMRSAGAALTLDSGGADGRSAPWVVCGDGDPIIEIWIEDFDDEHPLRSSYPEAVWQARIGQSDSAAQAMLVAAGLAHACEGWVCDPQACHDDPPIKAKLPRPFAAAADREHSVYDPEFARAIAGALAALGV
ncbi:MAG: hypothetical protein AB7V26_12250 [Lysobacterales bacterium]